MFQTQTFGSFSSTNYLNTCSEFRELSPGKLTNMVCDMMPQLKAIKEGIVGSYKVYRQIL